VDAAVTTMVLRYGAEDCGARVATEFGDHPETAVPRMAWVRRILADLAPVPATA